MIQNASPINHLQKLSTLIDGYKGYTTPSQRTTTTELFEAFLTEKLKTILRIIEDKYTEMTSEKKNLHLLIPLSNIIKNLTDAFHYASYERSQRLFFLHEYKFSWDGIEDTLCKMDYNILQYISMLVDKISHFEEESKNRFEAFSPIVLMFRDKLSERKKFIYGINEKLIPVNQLLGASLKDIRERRIREETFKRIGQAFQLFPDRLNTYMDLFEAIQRYASYYVRLNENIPLIDFFDSAMLFISKYKQYIVILQQYLNRAVFETDEEKECEVFLKERAAKAPDFDKLMETLKTTKQAAEKKQVERKEQEDLIHQATLEYQKGYSFEKELRFVEAVALYQKTLTIDKEYPEAIEGIERCSRKRKVLSLYLKAHKKIRAGQKEKALELFEKVIRKASDFQEAHFFADKLRKEIDEEKAG